MVRLTFLFLILTSPLFAPIGLAQSGISPTAKHECERRGAICEVVRGGVTAGESHPLVSAMAPPRDDSDKWFITVVTSANCPHCEQLKAAFEKSDALRPYVNVENHADSWAHYKVIRIDDPAQQWRWANYKPTIFPTVLIQPPLNGRFGEAKTILPPIVGYAGDARYLAATIRKRIGDYVEQLDASQAPLTPAASLSDRQSPFSVLPPEDKTQQPPFSFSETNMDPLGTILNSLLAPMFGSFGMTGAVIVGFGAFLLIREWRKTQGKPQLVSDASVAAIEKLIEQAVAKRLNVAPPSPPSAS